MCNKITEKELEEIKKTVEEEFPNDPALQHVHIARKIIAKEAKLAGKGYFDFLKSQKKRVRSKKGGFGLHPKT